MDIRFGQMATLTYVELGKALKIKPASAHRLARRKGWPRLKGNDGKVRVALPDDALLRPDSPMDIPSDNPSDIPPDNNQALIRSLEAHVETLKEQLSAAEARAEKQAADLSADLSAERERADKAIAAFASLAERLDALAVERARPWWRRLRITG